MWSVPVLAVVVAAVLTAKPLLAQTIGDLEPDFQARFEEDLPVSSIGAVRGAYYSAAEPSRNGSLQGRLPYVARPEGSRLCVLMTSKDGAYSAEGPYPIIGVADDAEWLRLRFPKVLGADQSRFDRFLETQSPQDLAVRVFAATEGSAHCEPESSEGGPGEAAPVLLPVLWAEEDLAPTELQQRVRGSAHVRILVNGVAAGRSQLLVQSDTIECDALTGNDFNRYSHTCAMDLPSLESLEVRVRFRSGRRVRTSPPLLVMGPANR